MSEHAREQQGGGADGAELPADLDLIDFTKALIGDLNGLRTGRVTIPQARASAELARQIIRAMHLVVNAQRLIESRAKTVGGEDQDEKTTA